MAPAYGASISTRCPPSPDLGPFGTPTSSFIVSYQGAAGGPSQLVFTALACAVPAGASSLALLCQTAPGAGAGLLVAVAVAGQAAPVFLGSSIAYCTARLR